MDERISIVIPVFNEEDNIRALYDCLVPEIDQLWYDFEIIFVDDGSSDQSADVVKRIAKTDGRVKLVRFTRNFGHQFALTAGIEHASGAAVITMDADLQHPAALIPKMIGHWEEGFEVVYTIRRDTNGAGLLKRVTARAFYWLINRITDTTVEPGAADFRLMDRKVVDCLNSLRERSRFLRGLVSWFGFRQLGIPYVADKRFSGDTKYSVRKMASFAVDGITSFSRIPLRAAGYLGFVSALLGIPYAVWAVYARFFTEQTVPGWASLIVAILFLGGVQLIFLGILGEYVGKIYEEVKGRPSYITRERVGFAEGGTRLDRCDEGDGRDTSISRHAEKVEAEDSRATSTSVPSPSGRGLG